jgi:hypothetical protein
LNVTVGLEPSVSPTAALNASSAGVAAVHYSLDGHSFTRVNGSKVAVRGLTTGAHQLHIKAEDSVGSIERSGRVVSWHTSQRGEVLLDAAPLVVVPQPAAGPGVISFDMAGWCSGSYMWRLDGSAWSEAVATKHHEYVVVDTAFHFWEALPVTNGAVWTQAPLVYSWSKQPSVTTHGAMQQGLAVSLGTFLDGKHSMTVKAIDAAGNLCHLSHKAVFTSFPL